MEAIDEFEVRTRGHGYRFSANCEWTVKHEPLNYFGHVLLQIYVLAYYLC